ncbi:MAG: ABC transporter permease subunit [Fodinibius sp.]|nr:ABC transporter permease subunit [Fodinibius sp.]
MALPLAYIGVRYKTKLSNPIERVAYLGYATPPLAFALAFVFFSLQVSTALYQSLLLLIIAYSLHFLAEGIGPVRSALYQTPPHLEEAAQSLGYSSIKSFFNSYVAYAEGRNYCIGILGFFICNERAFNNVFTFTHRF